MGLSSSTISVMSKTAHRRAPRLRPHALDATSQADTFSRMASVAATLPHKLAEELSYDNSEAEVGTREEERTHEVTREAADTVAHEAAPATRAAPRTIAERLAVLEATSATKADLAEVKASLIKWVLGVGASALVAFIALLFATQHSLNSRIDQVQSDMTARIDSAVAELRAENRATNERIDQINQRLDSVIEKIDAKFDQTNQRLDRLFELMAAQAANKQQ